VSRVSGDESILMRFLFSSSNTVLSNGYSIVTYPRGFSNRPSSGTSNNTSPKAKKDSSIISESEAESQANEENEQGTNYEEDQEKKWEIDLSKVERTWDGSNDRWIHKFPLREKVERDKKISYKLVETEVLDGVGVRQVYIDRAALAGSVTDAVAVLIWLI
jgi:hypothetical protein